MRDIGFQIRRGMTWKTVACCLFLLFYALLFPNFDFPAMFHDPIAFFKSEHFFYHFTIFFRSDMLRYLIPIAAILPSGFFFAEDQSSGFLLMEGVRQSASRYVIHRVLAALLSSVLILLLGCAVFTGVLWFISSPVMAPDSAAQSWMDGYAHSPFALFGTMEQLPLHVLWRFGTLLMAAVIWVLLAIGLSFLWPEKVFVFLGTFAGSLWVDSLLEQSLGIEYTVSFLMSPDFMIASCSMKPYLLREGLYAGIAGCFCGTAAMLRFFRPIYRKRTGCPVSFVHRTWNFRHLPVPRKAVGKPMARLLMEICADGSIKTLLPAVIVPLLILLCKRNALPARPSTGDLLMQVFGGLFWFDPVVSLEPVGNWLLALLPAMSGVAIHMEREMGMRMYLCIHRYPSRRRWWLSQYLACNLYVILVSALMFLTVIVASVLMGAESFGIRMADAEGFPVQNDLVLFQLFHVFTWQLLFLSQIQMLFHALFHQPHMGFLAHLLPLLVVMISFSTFDRTANVLIPYQWGMLLRSELFSPSSMPGAGNARIPLCATPMQRCLYGQMIITALLGMVNGSLGSVIRFPERRQNR